MLEVEINNDFENIFSSKKIEKVLQKTFDFLVEVAILESKKKVSLSVALIDEENMLKLNEKYRNKKATTDVLSFCYKNEQSLMEGEIILSPKTIEKWATKDGENFKKEFCKNLIHGFLHIAGFEHSDEMFGLQEKILAKVK